MTIAVVPFDEQSPANWTAAELTADQQWIIERGTRLSYRWRRRQAEEAPDEAPFYDNPVFDAHDGRFFGKWNRNRILWIMTW